VAGVLGAVPQALLPAPVRWGLFVLVALPVLGREAGLLRFRVPENARLVPEDVQHLRQWGALQFGFEMGTGVRTYSPSALPHLVLVAVVLVVPFGPAFAAAAGFAAGRLLMPVLARSRFHCFVNSGSRSCTKNLAPRRKPSVGSQRLRRIWTIHASLGSTRMPAM